MKRKSLVESIHYIYSIAKEPKFSTPWCILDTMADGGIRAYINTGYARVGTYVRTNEELERFSVNINSVQLDEALKSLHGEDVSFKTQNNSVVIKSGKQQVTLPLQLTDPDEIAKMNLFFSDQDLGNLVGEFEGSFLNILFALAKGNSGAIYFDSDFISMVPFMGTGLMDRRPKNLLYYKVPCPHQCSIHIFISRSIRFPASAAVRIFASNDTSVNITVPGTRISFDRLQRVEQARPDRLLFSVSDLELVGHAKMPDKTLARFNSDIVEWKTNGTVTAGSTDAEYTEEVDGEVLKDFKTGIQLIKDGEYDIYEHPNFIRFENDTIVMLSGKIKD